MFFLIFQHVDIKNKFYKIIYIYIYIYISPKIISTVIPKTLKEAANSTEGTGFILLSSY